MMGTAADAFLVFPPMSTRHGSPELGVPQLTANLRAMGFSVRQFDLNIEFLGQYLMDEANLSRLVRTTCGVSRIANAAGDPSKLLDVLFLEGLKRKKCRYLPEPTLDFAQFMTVNRARHSITPGIHDEQARARFLQAAGAGGQLHATPGADLESPDAIVAELLYWCRNGRFFYADLAEGMQEIYLSPVSFDLADVLDFTANDGTFFREFFASRLATMFAHGTPRVLGCSIYSVSQIAPALILAEMAKAIDPRLRVVFGGPWCSMARRLLPHIPDFFRHVDGVVLYEGEAPLAEYLRRVVDGRDPAETFNLVHASAGTVTENPIRPPLSLYDLQFPTYDGLPMDLYFDRKLTLRLFRGCYWGRCVFCNDTCDSVARREEFHSQAMQLLPDAYLERLMAHIQDCIERYGQRVFNHADTTVPVVVLRQFADAILQRGISIDWRSFMRFVRIPASVCHAMARSGCTELKMGLEACSDVVLKRLSKGFSLRTVHSCLDNLADAGIPVKVFVMGLPFQSPREFEESLQYIIDRMPHVHEFILQRFVLVGDSPLLRDPAAFGLRLEADLQRNLQVYALEYEPLGGLGLYQFIAIADSAHKLHAYARRPHGGHDKLFTFTGAYPLVVPDPACDALPAPEDALAAMAPAAATKASPALAPITTGQESRSAEGAWFTALRDLLFRGGSLPLPRGWQVADFTERGNAACLEVRSPSANRLDILLEPFDPSRRSLARTQRYSLSYAAAPGNDTPSMRDATKVALVLYLKKLLLAREQGATEAARLP